MTVHKAPVMFLPDRSQALTSKSAFYCSDQDQTLAFKCHFALYFRSIASPTVMVNAQQ